MPRRFELHHGDSSITTTANPDDGGVEITEFLEMKVAEAAAEPYHVPVFLSSLVLCPLIQTVFPKDAEFVIFTADGSKFSDDDKEHLLTELATLDQEQARLTQKRARLVLEEAKQRLEQAGVADVTARLRHGDLIENLQQMGKTILLSSHILTELSDMVSSVAILEKGRVLASGPVGDIGRKLRPDRAVKLRLLAYPDGCETPFKALPDVVDAERGPDGDLRIMYRGGDETVAQIVTAAVNAGFAVVRVEPERDDLEHIFLEVTRGELQ